MSRSRIQGVMVVMSVAVGAGTLAAADSITITECVVRLVDEARVPAAEPGVIKSIHVTEGQQVKAGEVLARLDESEAAAKLKIADFEYRAAMKQAMDDVRVKLARAEAEVVETEFLRGNNVAADADSDEKKRLRRLLLAPRRAQLKANVAQLEQDVLKLTSQVKMAHVQAAQVKLARRQVVSPLDGIVVQIFQHAGEWANPGSPIFHVARMERQRVAGYVNAKDVAPEEVLGRKVTITVNDRRGLKRVVTSKIGFASPIVESSGQYRVWADVDNRQEAGAWLLRPGLTADMTIDLK